MNSLFLFRNDLRLNDHPLLKEAILASSKLDLAVLIPEDFECWGIWRQKFWHESVLDLRSQIEGLGSGLSALRELPTPDDYDLVFCAEIMAHNEKEMLKGHIHIKSMTVDSLVSDFNFKKIPQHFTPYRHLVEEHLLNREPQPFSGVDSLPPCVSEVKCELDERDYPEFNPRSSIPFKGGEQAALIHLENYFFKLKLASSYKETRNEMTGVDYSTKFSPWLALGCLSPLTIERTLKKYEQTVEKNQSTYWIFFELLWRDFFRLMYAKYGISFFQSRGISQKKPEFKKDPELLRKWCCGETGVDLVDACMKELTQTGYLSNRGRQIAASYLINELNLNWCLGASFFEKHLVDYDVYSNWGNWMYLAGVGFDPRGKRWFNQEKQAEMYDGERVFRNLWLSSSAEKHLRP